MKPFVLQLRTAAWRTAGARYNAARRLKQRETFSTFSLALLSALSVAAAVAQRIYSPQSGTPLDNYLTAVSIALGVFLLAISLLEWGAANGAKAESLHRNAEELNAYQLKLAHVVAQMDAGKAVEDARLDALRVEYEVIKDRCQHNHKPVDDELFLARHWSAPDLAGASGAPASGRWSAIRIWVLWHWSTVWFFLLVWVAVATAGSLAWWIPKA